MYALTNSMAEIMMMSRATKGRPTKGKEQQKKKTKLNKNTQTKPDLSNWSKFNVVTVTDYPGTKDRQRRNGTSHSWSAQLKDNADYAVREPSKRKEGGLK